MSFAGCVRRRTRRVGVGYIDRDVFISSRKKTDTELIGLDSGLVDGTSATLGGME
jgi:hypothetical protein